MKLSRYLFFIAIVVAVTCPPANGLPAMATGTVSDVQDQATGSVSGVVFHDRTGCGAFISGTDLPIEGVAVSNGREIAVTGADGLYELPLRDNSAVFVIKPRDWMVEVDKNMLPRFYHLHGPSGATGSKFEGMPPTVISNSRADFPLYPSPEPDKFDVLVFGDTQPRDEQEIYYLSHDVLAELTGTGAAFGVTLGDIVFDDLDLFGHLAESIATIGIPWRYVLGNHDIDFSADNDYDARGTWYRTFGPSYYSFTYGPAHFIVLDNIKWLVDGDKRFYRTGLGTDQMQFLRNELERIGEDRLVFLMVHIPYTGSTAWQSEEEREELYRLLADYPQAVSLVAHTHRHYHHFLGEDEGFPGDRPHHMVSVGTVCGSWWTGAPDNYGIPHAMMSDGTPLSYTFLHIDEGEWKMSLQAARRPGEFQMHIHAPDHICACDDATDIIVNIFNALPTASVKMRFAGGGDWIPMERRPMNDPVRIAVMQRERSLGEEVPFRHLGRAAPSEHIWVANAQLPVEPGVYVIEVQAQDCWWEYSGRRLIHVR